MDIAKVYGVNKTNEEDALLEDRLIPKIFRAVLQYLFPLKMLLNVYSTIILLLDVSWIFIYSIYAILKTGYEVIKPPALKSINKDIVLVIGSGRGVGREIALKTACLGARILCIDINQENNDKTVAEGKRIGGDVDGYVCDITKKDNIAKLHQEIKEKVGIVTMIFYCCGIPSPRSLLENTHTKEVHKTLDLTLTSYFWILDAFLPDMKDRNHGHIVTLTSVAGLSHVKEQLPLSVAQFAIQGLAYSLMEELRLCKKDNVHVTLVHIYPFIISGESEKDIRLRIPSYFGTISARAASRAILDSVRRNYVEVSVPKHLLFLAHLLRVLPRRATILIRELLDTGVDFA